MKSVLILFDFKDWEQVDEIAKDLRSNNKKVTLWTILPKGEIAPAIDGFRIMESNELSCTSGVKAEVASEFEGLEYDTLISLFENKGSKLNALHYLLAINTASLCIGIYKMENYKPFDFVLLKDENANLVETYKQIKQYTAHMVEN